VIRADDGVRMMLPREKGPLGWGKGAKDLMHVCGT